MLALAALAALAGPWLLPAAALELLASDYKVEIPLLQRFSLFLSNPLYAAATVLAAVLVFSGLGARFSARLQPAARWPFVAIAATAGAYALLLPVLLPEAMGPWRRAGNSSSPWHSSRPWPSVWGCRSRWGALSGRRLPAILLRSSTLTGRS